MSFRPISLALVIGHEPARAGAKGTYRIPGSAAPLVISEYEYNSMLAGKVMERLSVEPRVRAEEIRRHVVGGYSALPRYINKCRFDLALELHFNAADNPAATGTEVLYWHRSAPGLALARIMQAHIVITMGTRDRGTKPVDAMGRGAPFLRGTYCPALILEPFFGSNPTEMGMAMNRMDDLARAYAAGIRDLALALQSPDTLLP